VSFLKEFSIGFTHPLRDLAGSFVLYFLYSTITGDVIESTIPTSGGYSFNIWIFWWFFVIFSIFDNLIGIIYDGIVAPDNPIDETPRYAGLFIGVFFWGSALIDIYTRMGGDLGNIILSVISAGLCVLVGMILRLSVSTTGKRGLVVEQEKSPWQ
jgi:hypothetical protein